MIIYIIHRLHGPLRSTYGILISCYRRKRVKEQKMFCFDDRWTHLHRWLLIDGIFFGTSCCTPSNTDFPDMAARNLDITMDYSCKI